MEGKPDKTPSLEELFFIVTAYLEIEVAYVL
jgi:hypothetical protein